MHVDQGRMIMGYLPVPHIALEASQFSFIALDNLNIQKWMYQKAPLAWYGSVNDAVDSTQELHYLFCGKAIKHYHIVPGSRNGSDTIANFAGLCEGQYDLIQKDKS